MNYLGVFNFHDQTRRWFTSRRSFSSFEPSFVDKQSQPTCSSLFLVELEFDKSLHNSRKKVPTNPALGWVCLFFFGVFKQTFIFPPQKSCELLVTWGSIGCLGETSERGEVEEKGDTQDTICRETALNFRWWKASNIFLLSATFLSEHKTSEALFWHDLPA